MRPGRNSRFQFDPVTPKALFGAPFLFCPFEGTLSKGLECCCVSPIKIADIQGEGVRCCGGRGLVGRTTGGHRFDMKISLSDDKTEAAIGLPSANLKLSAKGLSDFIRHLAW